MLQVDVPGRGMLSMEHLVLDVNGTIAFDGDLLKGVREGVAALEGVLQPVVVTADTHGSAEELAAALGVHVRYIEAGLEAEQKLDLVESLGPDRVVAVGNGANDREMLRASALGICVIGREGAAGGTAAAADIVVCSIDDALGMLAVPQRLMATLRR